MQVNQPQGGAVEAITPRYDTIVIRGAKGFDIPNEFDGGEVVAWSLGHGLAAMDALEEFVDDLAAGNCKQPTHLTQGAADALNLMRRRRVLGWDADEPTEQPPADWKTSVTQAVATARKVFGESADDAMQAIEYMAGLLLSREPETPSTSDEPFMFVHLHAGDVMDWTLDSDLAEAWELEGHTVSRLYTSPPVTQDLSGLEAEQFRSLRNVPDDMLGAPGVPCVAIPDDIKSGHYVSGADLDDALAAYHAKQGGAQ